MALREVGVPQHISILYVQQEVVGDDTLALESVLQADVHRTRLMQEEADLNALLQTMEDTDAADAGDAEAIARKNRKKDDAGGRLLEVQKLLVEIDADTGPSRAAELLAGLGFAYDDQVSRSPTWRDCVADHCGCSNCQLDRSLEDGGCDCRSPEHSSASLIFSSSMSRVTIWISTPSQYVPRSLSIHRASLTSILSQWLEEYLQTWPHTLLVVSHDRAFLNAVATDIIYQHNERLDYYKGQSPPPPSFPPAVTDAGSSGNFTQFYATKSERAKNQKREYEAQVQFRAHLQAFIDRWRCTSQPHLARDCALT